jgi:Na+/proline symporter
MTPTIVIIILISYFAVLILISFLTSRGADTTTFFTANRQSPWFLVAFGMIGSSLSGVTFISVPGNVGSVGFGYFQIVLGYLLGYWVIIGVLLPLYYRLNLVSIYTYFEKRFNFWSYKTGAFFFIVSRTLGSALRLFLAATVLQLFLFDAWGVPFYITVATTLVLIWLYTIRGGIKTIVYTDTFQTFFLVSAVCVAVWQISNDLGLSFPQMIDAIQESKYSRMFYFDDPNSPMFFFKQFIGGGLITITMTGMDQEIMQKNLTCKTLGDSQKNMFWFSIIMVIVNLLFLTMGALLFMYSEQNNIPIPARTDNLFPLLALNEFSLVVGIFFLLGITASSYASADSALAGLTTSFCIDFLNFKDKPESVKRRQKFLVHLGFSFVFLIIIVIFREVSKESVIDAVLGIAAYTYGPLLGLFSFGIFTNLQVKDKYVPVVCVMAPILCYILSIYSADLFGGYKMGLEALLINGILTFLGLALIHKRGERVMTL